MCGRAPRCVCVCLTDHNTMRLSRMSTHLPVYVCRVCLRTNWPPLVVSTRHDVHLSKVQETSRNVFKYTPPTVRPNRYLFVIFGIFTASLSGWKAARAVHARAMASHRNCTACVRPFAMGVILDRASLCDLCDGGMNAFCLCGISHTSYAEQCPSIALAVICNCNAHNTVCVSVPVVIIVQREGLSHTNSGGGVYSGALLLCRQQPIHEIYGRSTLGVWNI